jgi:hypothetical protein
VPGAGDDASGDTAFRQDAPIVAGGLTATS